MKLTEARALRAELHEAIRNAEAGGVDEVEFSLSDALKADDAAHDDLQAAIDEAE